MASKKLLMYWGGIFGFYFIVRFWRFVDSAMPRILADHLTDFLFIPWLVLGATLMYRWFFRKKRYTPNLWQVLVCVAGAAWYFEWYLPKYGPVNHIHVSDFLDVLAYLLGGVLTIFLLKGGALTK